MIIHQRLHVVALRSCKSRHDCQSHKYICRNSQINLQMYRATRLVGYIHSIQGQVEIIPVTIKCISPTDIVTICKNLGKTQAVPKHLFVQSAIFWHI